MLAAIWTLLLSSYASVIVAAVEDAFGPTMAVKVPSEVGLARVFIGLGEKVVALDVSDPSQPKVLGESNKLGQNVSSLAVSADGKLVFAAVGADFDTSTGMRWPGQLQVIDASEFPALKGFPVTGTPSGVDAIYSRVHVGPKLPSGIQTFFVALNDASILKGVVLALGVSHNSGASPAVSVLGRVEVGPTAWQAAWSDATRKVYVTGDHYVVVLNFTPENSTNALAVESNIPIDTYTSDDIDVNRDGSLAFVAADGDGLTVVDLRESKQLASLPTGGYCKSVTLAGSAALLAADPEVLLYDISNATSPLLLDSCLLQGDQWNDDTVWAVEFGSTSVATSSPNVALVAHYTGGLQILGIREHKLEVLSHFGRGRQSKCGSNTSRVVMV